MDIFYSTRRNFKLFKSYQDKNEQRQKGWRIWALRHAQMIFNLGCLIAVVFALFEIRNQEILPHWKIFLWGAIMGLQVILSFSGLFLYLLAKFTRSPDSWVIWSGIYNIFQSHFLIFAWMLGSHDVFFSRRQELVDDKVFYITVVATVFCFIGSIVYFVSAIFPTPFPPLLRNQSTGLDDDTVILVDSKEQDANLENGSATTASEQLEIDSLAASGSVASSVPEQNPSESEATLKQE